MANFHSFSLGAFSCLALQDDEQEIDVRQEFPQIPESELLATLQKCGYSDFSRTIGFNCLYVFDGKNHLLIDCGKGDAKLVDSLKAAGIHPAQIDYLIITHSDFDHIGGIDNFPKAKIVFPKIAWDLWTNFKSRLEMIDNFKTVFLKFLPADFIARAVAYRENYGAEKLPSLKERMIFVDPEEEFLPGFKMAFFPGHRPDHFAVEINSEEKILLHIADGFRHAFQVDHPDWYSRFDSYPAQMAESLRKIIARADSMDALIFGAHFQFPGLAKLEQGRLVLLEN